MSCSQDHKAEPTRDERKPYEAPKCQTLSMDEIVRELGPAVAVYGGVGNP